MSAKFGVKKPRKIEAAQSLRELATEQPNPRTEKLGTLSTVKVLRAINREDAGVHRAVGASLEQIGRVVDRVAALWIAAGHLEDPKKLSGRALIRRGRLFYVGAGTSGRLACVDASELPPTYGVPPTLVQAIIAGGSSALRRSIEGAEDDGAAGAADIRLRRVGRYDAVLGLSASGRAAFVRDALREARARGAFTACLTCNRNSPLLEAAEVGIVVETGPEAVAGSTRMKAGTAQKMVLNMLSTALMIRMGRVRGNRMTQLQIKCQKLLERAALLVMDECGVSYAEALAALKASDGAVSAACTLLNR